MAMSKKRKEERKIERREAKLEAARVSIAHQAKITGKSVGDYEVTVTLLNGVMLVGYLDEINETLVALNYRKMRVTSNMLNPAAGDWLIDASTPRYCDPASESYHSM